MQQLGLEHCSDQSVVDFKLYDVVISEVTAVVVTWCITLEHWFPPPSSICTSSNSQTHYLLEMQWSKVPQCGQGMPSHLLDSTTSFFHSCQFPASRAHTWCTGVIHGSFDIIQVVALVPCTPVMCQQWDIDISWNPCDNACCMIIPVVYGNICLHSVVYGCIQGQCAILCCALMLLPLSAVISTDPTGWHTKYRSYLLTYVMWWEVPTKSSVQSYWKKKTFSVT